MRRLPMLMIGVVLLLAPALTTAADLTLPASQAGDDAREDAPPPCQQELDFLAGVSSAAQNLQVGGTAYGCDTEWATSLEFDLTGLRAGLAITSAELVVRKTGYADDAQGFFYLGVFAYAATGAPVPVPRAVLTPVTALAILFPPQANVDLTFDVTGAVLASLQDGAPRLGMLLAGIESEAGYEDWISVGGVGHEHAPRLVVTYEGPVQAALRSWTQLKADFGSEPPE